MNRRGFIGALGLGAAGLVADFDWDRLLWEPKPIITVPAIAGRATVRWPIGDVVYTFRNLDIAYPPDLIIEANEWEHRKVGDVDIRADVRVLDRVVPYHRIEKIDHALVHAGNTITLQWGSGPMVQIV